MNYYLQTKTSRFEYNNHDNKQNKLGLSCTISSAQLNPATHYVAYIEAVDVADKANKHNITTTTLSHHVLKLEEEGKQYTVKWEILDRAPTFNPVTKKCRLCLKEIYYIMFRPDSASLNRRSELFNTCRHRRQPLLKYS